MREAFKSELTYNSKLKQEVGDVAAMRTRVAELEADAKVGASLRNRQYTAITMSDYREFCTWRESVRDAPKALTFLQRLTAMSMSLCRCQEARDRARRMSALWRVRAEGLAIQTGTEKIYMGWLKLDAKARCK